MLPRSFLVSPGSTTLLTLTVGENFVGDQVAFTSPLVASLRQYSLGKAVDLRDRVPANEQLPELPVVVSQAGTYLVAFDTHPSQLVLSADKFHAYLHEEGLDFIIKSREAAGNAALPGRERFRRNIKTLLQAGTRGDATYAVRTGQKLEIVPLANPSAQKRGGDMAFQVLFDGKPLANALVKSWHKRGGQTLIIRTITNGEGKVTVALPWSGAWMVSVVHMVPVTDSQDHDWDSYWGNLTFALPEKQ